MWNVRALARNDVKAASAVGQFEAQFNLVNMNVVNQGSTQRNVEAAHWCHMAAAQGGRRAQWNAGGMYI